MFFITFGQVGGEGRGEGFTGSMKNQKFNNYTISSVTVRTSIVRITIGEGFFIFCFIGTDRRRG